MTTDICGAEHRDATGALYVCSRKPGHGGDHQSPVLRRFADEVWPGITWPNAAVAHVETQLSVLGDPDLPIRAESPDGEGV